MSYTNISACRTMTTTTMATMVTTHMASTFVYFVGTACVFVFMYVRRRSISTIRVWVCETLCSFIKYLSFWSSRWSKNIPRFRFERKKKEEMLAVIVFVVKINFWPLLHGKGIVRFFPYLYCCCCFFFFWGRKG